LLFQTHRNVETILVDSFGKFYCFCWIFHGK
jgi:hypothetical protein